MSPFTLNLFDLLSNWVMLVIIFLFILVGWLRGVRVYEEFVKGAKEGFDVAVMIIPYLVAILCAIWLFRYGGAMDAFKAMAAPVTGLIGMDPELLPLALIRPMSGGGARGVMFSIWEATGGPDTIVGLTASVMQGSTETTFYVLAVYCGVVGIRKVRYTLVPCLLADVTGIIAAVLVSNWYFKAVFGIQ